MIEHRTIVVRGRVQGVRFRVSAQGEADRLGLHGYAKNKPDGAVCIAVEGESDALDTFVAWCRKGPLFAHVEYVEVCRGDLQGLRDFEVQ
ncbi:acylphosphatase [Candidatus Uhrbacteria bacterium]|nr:acylphosphatase [Candidatus Uhrbacteria bacterium]